MSQVDDYSPEAWAKMMHWQTIWLRTIAKAWSDEEFKNQLLADARNAIGEAFNYDLPWTLNLTVKEPETTEKAGRNYWDLNDLPDMELTMYLPPKPDLRHQAVAIADYAETGRTYPFTCC